MAFQAIEVDVVEGNPPVILLDQCEGRTGHLVWISLDTPDQPPDKDRFPCPEPAAQENH